uniref:Uncharacterized protein n=1 Tax=Amphimedon queenslandica TaxID=400682 RepID=A0A1X7T3W4_AMPQE
MNFIPDQSYSNCSWKEKEQIMTPLFYEQDFLKNQKKTLIDRYRKEQPHKPIPIMKF